MEAAPTRRDRQAQTRERLLEVAAEVLIEGGYRAATLERIAELAGFSKGAVYSNFEGKEDLTLAVLDRHFAHRLEYLQAALLAAPETLDARVQAFTSWWEEMVGHEAWGVLILEFSSATRDRPQIQAQLAEREQMIIDFTAGMVEAEAQRFSVDLPLPSREVASILVSLGSGLAFSRMLDPSIPTSILSDLAHILFIGRPGQPDQPV
ncbi:MAG: TetR/AcrR family transcriptional regulator [Aquihabitans sp.]